MAKLELGQVVYVTTDTKQRILPGLLVEELVTRTIDGTRVTYVVQVGKEQKAKFEEDKVFPTLKRAREVLLQKFVVALDKLLDNAETLAVDWYGDKAKKPVEEPPAPKRVSKRPSVTPPRDDLDLPANPEEVVAEAAVPQRDDRFAQVTMPDGTVARIRVPII